MIEFELDRIIPRALNFGIDLLARVALGSSLSIDLSKPLRRWKQLGAFLFASFNKFKAFVLLVARKDSNFDTIDGFR